MKLAWSEDLALGVTRLDDQHREFLRMAGDLVSICEDTGDSVQLRAALKRFHTYAEEHLHLEEQVMHRLAFPGMERHCASHGEFRRNLSTLSQRLTSDAPVSALTLHLCTLALAWSQFHISTEDRAFADWAAATRANKGPRSGRE